MSNKGCQRPCGSSDYYPTGKCHANGCYTFEPWSLNELIKRGVRVVVEDRVVYAQLVRSFKIGGIIAQTYIAHRDCGSLMTAGTGFTLFHYTEEKAGHQYSLFHL